MGLAIDREEFCADDYQRFSAILEGSLSALTELLAQPDFGSGAPSLGSELELSLIGPDYRASPVNLDVLAESMDQRLTFELNRFNLECNLQHGPLAGRPFEALAGEMHTCLREVRRAAALHGADAAAIGILPTLRVEDLQSAAMTDTARFRALSRSLQERRAGPFQLRIDGAEPLEVAYNDVTSEGAATSLQVHLRIPPRDFKRFFNAAQVASVAAIAICGNSPTFLGHRLWQETRVALFKQAVDDRTSEARRTGRPARVSFGTNWVRDGALELFVDSVKSHAPLLPVVSGENPVAVTRAGGIPRLEEIRLHQGTVWSWNRPVYDPADGGHVRIELRCLAAGPSVLDMVANVAYLVGLTFGIAQEDHAWQAGWDFDLLHGSFYRAAQDGLDATLAWPAAPSSAPIPTPATAVVEATLPIAERGLLEAGVESDEVSRQLDLLANRLARGATGSRWQLETLDGLERSCPREEALTRMTERYLENSKTDEPVHDWPVES